MPLRRIHTKTKFICYILSSIGDIAKNRKKYESEILELESQLELTTRGSGDYQKTIKKLQSQIKVSVIFYREFCDVADAPAPDPITPVPRITN